MVSPSRISGMQEVLMGSAAVKSMSDVVEIEKPAPAIESFREVRTLPSSKVAIFLLNRFREFHLPRWMQYVLAVSPGRRRDSSVVVSGVNGASLKRDVKFEFALLRVTSSGHTYLRSDLQGRAETAGYRLAGLLEACCFIADQGATDVPEGAVLLLPQTVVSRGTGSHFEGHCFALRMQEDEREPQCLTAAEVWATDGGRDLEIDPETIGKKAVTHVLLVKEVAPPDDE